MVAISGRPVVKVFSRSGDVYLGTVAAKSLSWRDDLGGGGGGSFTMSAADPFFKRYPTALDDALVKIAVPLSQGAVPTDVAMFPTSPTSGTLIDSDGNTAHELSVTLLSPLYLFHDWVVYPRGPVSAATLDDRQFGWTDPFYDDTSAPWATPQGNKYNSTMAWRVKNKPPDWPDKSAYWITGGDPSAPVETETMEFFRTDFHLDVRTTVRIFATGDDYFIMYVNGQLFMQSNQDKIGDWKKTFKRDITFDPGDHNIAVTVRNGDYEVADHNFMAFICSIIRVNENGTLGTVMRRSNTTQWRVYRGVTPPPGLTAAGILLTLIAEAANRGVRSAQDMTPTFTQDLDSDGLPWEDVIDRTFAIGSTHGDQVAEDLSEVAFDLDLRPNYALNAYTLQRHVTTARVAIGYNLVSYSWEGYVIAETRMLVRTAVGWVETADGTAEALYGRREGAIISGFSNTLEQGDRIAQSRLEEGSQPRQVFTATIVAVKHSVPYVDFTKGDIIWGLDSAGNAARVRVLSIGASVSDDSSLTTYQLELEMEPAAPIDNI